MSVSKWEILKLSEAYDGEFDFESFSEEEIAELLGLPALPSKEALRERYFAEHDDVKDRGLPFSGWSA